MLRRGNKSNTIFNMAIMGQYDLEGVLAVAIDEDWSTLRFRKVEYILKMTRKFGALPGKEREKRGQG